jgi:hypothetical protein
MAKKKPTPAPEPETPAVDSRWAEMAAAEQRLNTAQIALERFMSGSAERKIVDALRKLELEVEDAEKGVKYVFAKNVDLVGPNWIGYEARQFRDIDATFLYETLDDDVLKDVVEISMKVNMAAYDEAVAHNRIPPEIIEKAVKYETRIFSPRKKK